MDADAECATASVATTCPYCGVGCGINVTLSADGEVGVRGDRNHPANLGRLCSKGLALAETIDLDGRLLHPSVDGQQCDWDAALDAVSSRLRTVIDEDGPDAVALYVSGQLLTEDYYVANKLMKGFIGSANIDTNSRLCMSSAVAAYKRAFGSDTVPNNYEDLEQADLIVIVGSNLAWCHPVLYQRILAARKQRPLLKVVVVDPRRTATCDAADLHLQLRSGTDAVLFNGLLNWLDQHAQQDENFIASHTDGYDEALSSARWYAPNVEAVATQSGLSAADVRRFYALFGETKRVVTLFSQGVNQSSSGTDKGNAIINCHLLTGRIGYAGAGPFSITGQPNAMGGREVGGLANQLAAHMELADDGHRTLVGEFWGTDTVAARPGLKAVDLFHAIEQGSVKALWIMATNPAVSLPDNEQVRRALARCPCVIVSDCSADTDTQRYAHIRLPALAWGEKDGTVTNSERCISRQRPFLPAPGDARPDWQIVSDVARRMGYSGFDYDHPLQVFDEHARLSTYQNGGERDFDIGGLAGMSIAEYDALQPVQWPVRRDAAPLPRMFGDGRFFTPSGRANFVAVTPRPPQGVINAAYPLVLNTGRVRDHWHTMTRTGKSPRLSGHVHEPFVAMHPVDAEAAGVHAGALVTVASAWGEAILRVRVSEEQQPGHVFVPMHWNDQFAPSARIGAVINPFVDPVSGQPEFKHTPVRVVPYQASWYGFLLTRREVLPEHATYWSKARRYGLWHYELAGEVLPADWAAYARSAMWPAADSAEWPEMQDSTQRNYRGARIVDGRLDAVIMIGPDTDLPPRDWLADLFKRERIELNERARLLSGSPPSGQQDAGAIVCSCFGVGVNTLINAIRDQHLVTPEAIGAALGAGTNCGSCVPELRRLIADNRQRATG